MQKPQSWYVYTYSLPGGTVFYVGKGTGNRINANEDEASRGCPCKKCTAIRGVWASGHSVQKKIVFESFDHSEVKAIEREQILAHVSPSLTNALMPITYQSHPRWTSRSVYDRHYSQVSQHKDEI